MSQRPNICICCKLSLPILGPLKLGSRWHVHMWHRASAHSPRKRNIEAGMLGWSHYDQRRVACSPSGCDDCYNGSASQVLRQASSTSRRGRVAAMLSDSVRGQLRGPWSRLVVTGWGQSLAALLQEKLRGLCTSNMVWLFVPSQRLLLRGWGVRPWPWVVRCNMWRWSVFV